jgi:hypothetical protein
MKCVCGGEGEGHIKYLLESQGDRRAEHKATRIKSSDAVDIEGSVATHKDIHSELEDLRVVSHATDIVKAGNTMERVVWDHRCCRMI